MFEFGPDIQFKLISFHSAGNIEFNNILYVYKTYIYDVCMYVYCHRIHKKVNYYTKCVSKKYSQRKVYFYQQRFHFVKQNILVKVKL